LNWKWFIAKRLAFSKQSPFSALIIKIAIGAIAISLSVMIVATSIVQGFKKEVSEKVFGFSGHLVVKAFDQNLSLEDVTPVKKQQDFYPDYSFLPAIKNIQVYAHKAGILKTDEAFEGLVFKGISTDFDWDFFGSYLNDGNIFELSDTARSDAILLSEFTAQRLKLKVGDKVLAYFPDKRLRYRKFKLSGIYKTGLGDYDKKIALIDIKHIQKLNKWEADEVGGFMVTLNKLKDLPNTYDDLYYKYTSADLNTQSVREINPSIFDWLEIQNTNEAIILILMLLIGIINMTTALLILILERTNMIGILKALGAGNRGLQMIFLNKAAFIIGFGLLLGNLFGLGICLIQQYFEVVKLSEESYYLSVAPIYINWFWVIGLNVGTFIISLLALVVPSYFVSWVNPIKAIRFE